MDIIKAADSSHVAPWSNLLQLDHIVEARSHNRPIEDEDQYTEDKEVPRDGLKENCGCAQVILNLPETN